MRIKVTYLRKEKSLVRNGTVVNADDCIKEFNSVEDAKNADIPDGYSVAFFYAEDEDRYYFRLIDSEWGFSKVLGRGGISKSETENFCSTLDLNRPQKDFVVGEDYDENGNPLYRDK